MNFDDAEERDGLRFAWNVWPSSRLDATKNLVVPLGCLYTPLKKGQHNHPTTLYYEPIYCKGTCHSVLNPYCSVDIRGKLWVCPICYQRNQFPQHYADISETSLPAELIAQYTTIEYALPTRQPPLPPVMLFVVDTCLPEEELQALKDSILLSLTLIPENTLVGLITFGAMVQLHELAFVGCPKSYVFRGNKEVTVKQIQDLLSLSTSRPSTTAKAPGVQYRENGFLVPLSECELTLTSTLEELQHDPRPVKTDKRPMRATGVAISAAISLLESTYPNTGARVMLFVGGPATDGPGLIVGEELKEPIRSYSDVLKDKAKYVTKSSKFYEGLAKRAVVNGHAVDIFANSLDQVGFLEMRDLVRKTGGLVAMGDTFTHSLFQESFKHILANAINLGYNGTIEITTSRELKICGAIGLLSGSAKTSPCVSETEIGIGNTCSWRVCGLDPSTTFAFYFEVVNQHTNTIPQGQNGIIQFQTQYQNAAGQRILRVTTIARAWADTNAGIEPLAQGFDQEAAAVLMSRMAVFKSENLEDTSDILRWLDKMLIHLVRKYANYRKEDPSSFSLNSYFSLYPQFMFHLRRSTFLQVFGNSLDESTFYRSVLNRETVSNSLIMIQPTLESYSFNGPPAPVLLSSESIMPDRILLLDTFFTVVVFRGQTIAQWHKDGYHHDPKYESLKYLLAAPRDDAQLILKERFPYPRFVECDQGSSQARFILAIIDPTTTHNSTSGGKGEVIFTDDVSLKVFMDHLKKLAVAPQ